MLCLLAVAGPLMAEAASIAVCLEPCHGGLGIAPDIAVEYDAETETAGHRMNWDPRIVADTSQATHPQGSRLPCNECHVEHDGSSSSIYGFSTERTGGTRITTIRQLCEGCHRPFDSIAATPTVLGLALRRLPPAPADHGGASDRDCFDCHGGGGHGPALHSDGQDCGSPACHGGTGSHAIHMTGSDPRGPGVIHCYDCHGEGDLPYFGTGTDTDVSGHIELDETTSCDACHSPGGNYDGVDSTLTLSGAMSVGARDNWSAGAYATTSTLLPGKDKWCAGCHDGDEDTAGEEPSLIEGVYAPPVIGDEEGPFTYGTGYGYYETGHGTPTSTVLPSNGFDKGPGLACDACHDYEQGHIDGERRSFTSTGTADDYRTSYRLALVDGQNPLLVPRPSSNTTDNYLLCTQSECHDPYPFLNQTETTSTLSTRRTNLWWESGGSTGSRYNQHRSHLGFGHTTWARDWGAAASSRTQCVTCHNVHGSRYLGMIHDGSLISDTVTRTPGMPVYYYNDDVSTYGPFSPPDPADVTLAMSDALIWSGGSSGKLCNGCHGGGNIRIYRQLWKDYSLQPTLDWTGETNYESDGSHPESQTAEGTFFFRVEYTDRNNDAPSFVRLRIDRNDDGDCQDTSETVTLEKEAIFDKTFYDGMIYKTSLSLTKAGDNDIAYHFEASDGMLPTTMSETATVHINNATPALEWAGDAGYSDDGVLPNGGTTGLTSYEFRIAYRDPDGEAPAGGAPLLWVDADDDGWFEAGESTTMTAMAGGGYLSGKRYTHTTTLNRQGDDDLAYRFTASDGIDNTVSETMTVGVLQNINHAPVLSWTGESGYGSDGVDPNTQAGGRPFAFRVSYQDANNHAPTTAEVWIDLDDDGAYGATEKITMDDSVVTTDLAAADGDFSNGEIFAETVNVPFAGDGSLTYCFNFSDAASATGDPMDDGVPANDQTLAVLEALDVPSEYGTIQAGIDAAVNGQIVLVADGTYAERIDFGGKRITVESVNGAGSTSIEGTGTGTLVSFETAGSDSTLLGFTVSDAATGVAIGASTVTIQECVIEGMTGAGIQHGGTSADPLLVEDTTIRDSRPGVLSTEPSGRATFRRSDVVDNTVSGDGGGIHAAGSGIRSTGRWTFEDCTFSGNIAGGSGGAIYSAGSTFEVLIDDCVFEDNRANGGGGGAIGGYCTSNEAGTVNRTIFRGNYASGDGGAVRLQGPSSPFSLWTYTNCIFSGNYAGGDGGAFYRQGISVGVVFHHSTFSGNSADRGGGIYVENSFFDRIKVYSSVMFGDDARSSTTRDEWDTGNETFYRYPGIRYTDIHQEIREFVNVEGNFAADPMFVNPVSASSAPTSTGEYHLEIGSPCEGSADPSSTTTFDIDGDPRPEGSAVSDSGADEIDIVMATRKPVSITIDVPGLDPADPIVIPLLPTGMSVTPDEPTAVFAPTFTERDEGFLLVGSGARVQEPPARFGKGLLGRSAERPLGVPTSAPLTVGLLSMAALAWRAILDLLRSLR